MKRVIFILLFILVTFFSAYAGEPLKKELSVEPGKILNIELKSGGSLSVSGWDQPKAEMVATFANGDQNDWDIVFEKSNEGIHMECRYRGELRSHHRSPEFAFRVPHKFDLKVKTMGGSIKLDNIEGDISGRSMGGALELRQLKGKISMETMGGEISLTDSDIDGKVHTMGGHVRVENVTGDIKGSSMGGNVVYRNVKSRSGESSGETVRISTMGGSINVEYAEHGADVHTMGGEIHIKKAKEFAKAKTMGGAIVIDEIDGRVDAETMGGEIQVNMTGSTEGDRSVRLVSMGGDITLKVPEKLEMDFQLEIAVTRNAHKTYRISGDFPVNITETNRWESSFGTDRKFIRGSGKTGSGRNRIFIKTINGNIFINKTK